MNKELLIINSEIFLFQQFFRHAVCHCLIGALAWMEMIGGVLIAQGENWYYPNGLIEDTAATNGWSVLDLRNL